MSRYIKMDYRMDYPNLEESLAYLDKGYRWQILISLTKKAKLSHDVNLYRIAELTFGFSRGDLMGVVSDAMNSAIERKIKDNCDRNGFVSCLEIIQSDFTVAVNNLQSIANYKILLETHEEVGEDDSSSDDEVTDTYPGFNFKSSNEETEEQEVEYDSQSDDKKFKNIPVIKSQITFSNVGASDETFEELKKFMLYMRFTKNYKKFNIVPRNTFVIHGPAGCGKFYLAKAVAGELGIRLLRASSADLLARMDRDREAYIRHIFRQALRNAPCVLYIKGIDDIAPKTPPGAPLRKAVLKQFLTCIQELQTVENIGKVLIIGETHKIDLVHPVLLQPFVFDRPIRIGRPNKKIRMKILQVAAQHVELAPDVDFYKIAKQTSRYCGKKLVKLVIDAGDRAVESVVSDCYDLETGIRFSTDVSDCNIVIEQHHFDAVLNKRPRLSTMPNYPSVPFENWDEFGPRQTVRESLYMALKDPMFKINDSNSIDSNTNNGVLLSGLRGSGKSSLPPMIANEAGINFIYVQTNSVLDPDPEEREKAIRTYFTRARIASPCILFFDNLEFICPREIDEDFDDPSARDIIISEMKKLKPAHGVTVIAASKYVHLVDRELIKSRRFKIFLNIALPTDEDKLNILETLTGEDVYPELADDVKLPMVAKLCYCFTGEEVTMVIREAMIRAGMGTRRSMIPKKIYMAHFVTAIINIRPVALALPGNESD